MNSPNKIGDYFSRRFPFFTIFSNASYPELALLRSGSSQYHKESQLVGG